MSYGWETEIPYYSNPDVVHEGYPLGVSFEDTNSSDVSRAFFNNRYIAAGLIDSGSASQDALKVERSVIESDCLEDLEPGEPLGIWKISYLTNQGDLPIEVFPTIMSDQMALHSLPLRAWRKNTLSGPMGCFWFLPVAG